MQEYPGYGYKQESYVYVEDDDFMKGDYFCYNDSNVKMVRSNEWIPTPSYNPPTPPHHGGYYKGMKHGKESYWPSDKEQCHHHDSWKMYKPSHGGSWPNDKEQHHHHDSRKMDKPSHGWPNDREKRHNHDSWEMDKPSHGWPNEREQRHHHDSWEMDKPSHGWPNEREQHHHHESWKMDKPSHGGKKHYGGYDFADDMSYLKMGGSRNGGGYHSPVYEPVVLNKHYGDDCENHPDYSEHKKDEIWDFKGIDD